MAPSDNWPRIICERFDGETDLGYQRRSSRIVEIVTDFRMGRYDAKSGEAMECELMALQDPATAYDLSVADEMLARLVRRDPAEAN
jgi:hypothetical protein